MAGSVSQGHEIIFRVKCSRHSRNLVALAAWLFPFALWCGPTSAQSEGYYGDAQAARGAKLYALHCSECHGAELQGGGAVALTGDYFRTRWSEDAHSVDDLFYIVRTQMPYGAPGRLSKADYFDIVAFMLQRGGYRGMQEDVPLDAEELSAKKLKRRQ